MILRPQSLETFKTFQQIQSTQYGNSSQFRKKIQNFSFLPFDKIGRGYSSTVYKGQNDITKQHVAIKVIELKSLRDQNTKKFLQNELQCLRKLNHENNLKYINSFITSNNCYIITELYSQGDLSKVLKQKTRFSQSQAFQIFNQFYQGYLHFHYKGYIHRDIKPSNVLIQKKDSRLLYVIADFGFVKKIQQQPKDPFNVGTPVYMPPQSITSNIYTTKSDIWSMGVMLFQLVYGFLPFQSKCQVDLKREICNKQIRLEQIQQSHRIQTSYEFKGFLLNCLRKNPQNRISLNDIKQHQWFKKKSMNQFTVRFQNLQNQPQQICRKAKVSISKDKDIEQKKFGFIGNQVIKRQKSIQGNNAYSLKNYFKNPQKKLIIKNYDTCTRQIQKNYLISQKQNISFNIGLIKQKFNQINLSVEKQNQKTKNIGLLSSENYQNQQGRIIHKNNRQTLGGYLNIQNKIIDMSQSIHLNDFHNHSMKNINNYQKPNIFSPVLMKNSLNIPKQYPTHRQTITNRSSLLQGMKGVVNMKNNQISKIRFQSQNSINNRSSLIKKQSLVKKQNTLTLLQISTSIDQSIQKSNLRSQQLKDAQKSSILPVKRPNIIKNSISNQNRKDRIKQTIQPNEFIVKSIHILRYIFQTLSLGQSQLSDKYKQVKQALIAFFSMYLLKIKYCLLQKQNIFALQNWNQFIQSDKYQTFKQVISQYYERYSLNPKINKCLRQNDFDFRHLNQMGVSRYQKANLNILKQVQQIASLNKQINKKSVKNSAINSQIILIFNYHKCLQIIIKVLKNHGFNNIQINNDFLIQLNPDKDLQQLTTKNKDPFKIPKILIQLKKKIMQLQSSSDQNQPQDYCQQQYKLIRS